MRTYRKYTDVRNELRTLILSMRDSGKTRLEGERELAARLGTGRPTVAKALKQLELEQLIRCTKSGVQILPFRQRFRYAYVAAVHFINNTFWFWAYQHLWDELERLAQQQNIKIELVQFDPDFQEDPASRFLEQLEPYDVVFLSLTGHFKELALPDALRKRNRPVFLLNENMETDGFPLYCLGNFETGALAARLLLEHGYRNTAILAPCINTSSFDFRNRINGFSSVMEQNGAIFELFSTNAKANMEELNLIQRCVCQLPNRGFDSIFYLDDKWITISDPLIEAGLTPEFGILAVDGNMISRRHNPPIDTISHGTVPLARKICEIITEWELGTFHYDPTVRFRITPEFFRGRTLREPGK